MRTLLLFLLLLLGLRTLPLQAMVNGPADSPVTRTAMERELVRQIDKYVSYPLLERGNMDGEVTVSFVIDTDGRIVLIEASATNERLLDYVLRRLEKVDIGTNPEGGWRTTHIRFTFGPQA